MRKRLFAHAPIPKCSTPIVNAYILAALLIHAAHTILMPTIPLLYHYLGGHWSLLNTLDSSNWNREKKKKLA